MVKTNLHPERIVNTIERLGQRIEERFPECGLRGVCDNVLNIARNMEQRTEWIARPLLWLRVLTWLVTILVVTVVTLPIAWALMTVDVGSAIEVEGLHDWFALFETGVNDLVLIGAAIFFLLTMETRYKRQRALDALHEIRSIAHVIDMHQLTKDPHRILGAKRYQTELSPKMEMSRIELHRYLDYCSEMLALLGKIAAVYAQEFDDGVALASAAEIETLTTGLSQKIWPKIAILSTVENQINPPVNIDLVADPPVVLEKLPKESS